MVIVVPGFRALAGVGHARIEIPVGGGRPVGRLRETAREAAPREAPSPVVTRAVAGRALGVGAPPPHVVYVQTGVPPPGGRVVADGAGVVVRPRAATIPLLTADIAGAGAEVEAEVRAHAGRRRRLRAAVLALLGQPLVEEEVVPVASPRSPLATPAVIAGGRRALVGRLVAAPAAGPCVAPPLGTGGRLGVAPRIRARIAAEAVVGAAQLVNESAPLAACCAQTPHYFFLLSGKRVWLSGRA